MAVSSLSLEDRRAMRERVFAWMSSDGGLVSNIIAPTQKVQWSDDAQRAWVEELVTMSLDGNEAAKSRVLIREAAAALRRTTDESRRGTSELSCSADIDMLAKMMVQLDTVWDLVRTDLAEKGRLSHVEGIYLEAQLEMMTVHAFRVASDAFHSFDQEGDGRVMRHVFEQIVTDGIASSARFGQSPENVFQPEKFLQRARDILHGFKGLRIKQMFVKSFEELCDKYSMVSVANIVKKFLDELQLDECWIVHMYNLEKDMDEGNWQRVRSVKWSRGVRSVLGKDFGNDMTERGGNGVNDLAVGLSRGDRVGKHIAVDRNYEVVPSDRQFGNVQGSNGLATEVTRRIAEMPARTDAALKPIMSVDHRKEQRFVKGEIISNLIAGNYKQGSEHEPSNQFAEQHVMVNADSNTLKAVSSPNKRSRLMPAEELGPATQIDKETAADASIVRPENAEKNKRRHCAAKEHRTYDESYMKEHAGDMQQEHYGRHSSRKANLERGLCSDSSAPDGSCAEDEDDDVSPGDSVAAAANAPAIFGFDGGELDADDEFLSGSVERYKKIGFLKETSKMTLNLREKLRTDLRTAIGRRANNATVDRTGNKDVFSRKVNSDYEPSDLAVDDIDGEIMKILGSRKKKTRLPIPRNIRSKGVSKLSSRSTTRRSLPVDPNDNGLHGGGARRRRHSVVESGDYYNTTDLQDDLEHDLLIPRKGRKTSLGGFGERSTRSDGKYRNAALRSRGSRSKGDILNEHRGVLRRGKVVYGPHLDSTNNMFGFSKSEDQALRALIRQWGFGAWSNIVDDGKRNGLLSLARTVADVRRRARELTSKV